MTDDTREIVAHLRGSHGSYEINAADLIERLEKENKLLKEALLIKCNEDWDEVTKIVERARSALKEKP